MSLQAAALEVKLRKQQREQIEKIIESVFGKELQSIEVLKKGMTNHSFLIAVGGEKYILRIPGEGTEKLINRKQEADVFKTISGLGFCDDPVYLDKGVKISRYLENARTCDSEDVRDIEQSMELLKKLHTLELVVPHTFDLFGNIERYEKLCARESQYSDYRKTKERVFGLKEYVEKQEKKLCLCHIDAVADNFLFYPYSGGEALQLTDWEYAGMQDPHLDIAMFCVYNDYQREQIDRVIDLYFDGSCPPPRL